MRSRVVWCSSLCLFAVLVSLQLPAQSHKASMLHGGKVSKVSKGVTPQLAPSFAAAVQYNSGGNGANSVAIAQLRGTGQPYDLVVTNWCAYSSCTSPGTDIGVLLGNGDGTFQAAAVYSSGGIYADAIAVADMNGDGIPDLVIADCGANNQSNCAGGSVGVLLGVGDGTFGTAKVAPPLTTGATSVAVADLNGDGKLDVIIGTGSNTAGSVGVLLGNGDGTLQMEVDYGSGGLSPLSLAVADLGNGKVDVVVGNQWADSTDTNSNVGVLLGKGDGTFNTAVTYPTGGFFPDGIALADVNGDGKPDMVVANSSVAATSGLGTVGILLGNGDGTFGTTNAYPSGGYGAAAVALADVNGDGCSGTSGDCTLPVNGNVSVLVGNGDGTFGTAVSFAAGGNDPFGVAVGDVNGDGKPDIVAASCASSNCGATSGELGVLLNITLTPTATALASSPNPSSPGQSVTFTATVTFPTGFGKGTPTGTVTFFDGTTNIGNPALTGGVATLTTSTLAVGTSSITATYSGDTNFATSTSPAVQQVVQAAGFTLAASPSTVSISAPGGSGSTTITITTAGNLKASSVGNFACPSGLPSGATCTFGAVSSSGTVSLSIATMGASAKRSPLFGHHQQLFYAILLPGFLGMVSVAGRRRTLRGVRLLSLIVVLGLAALWVACGSGSTSTTPPPNTGTPAGTSTITVSATSGTLQGKTTFTLTVQ